MVVNQKLYTRLNSLSVAMFQNGVVPIDNGTFSFVTFSQQYKPLNLGVNFVTVSHRIICIHVVVFAQAYMFLGQFPAITNLLKISSDLFLTPIIFPISVLYKEHIMLPHMHHTTKLTFGKTNESVIDRPIDFENYSGYELTFIMTEN